MKRFRDEPPSHATLEGFIAAMYLVTTLRLINGEIDRASILAALRARRDSDVGGFVVAWPNWTNRGSRYVDLTLLRRNGRCCTEAAAVRSHAISPACGGARTTVQGA